MAEARLLCNPCEPADYSFSNLWANPWIPNSNPPRKYVRGRHGGLDFQGTYWLACADGIFRRRSYGADYGLQGQIDFTANGHLYEATYSHGAAVYPDAGAHVYAGERIGKVGKTGQVSGPHLHFEEHGTPGNWYSDFDPLEDVMASLSGDQIDQLKEFLENIKAAGSSVDFVTEAIKIIKGQRTIPLAALPAHTHPPASGGSIPAHSHTGSVTVQ